MSEQTFNPETLEHYKAVLRQQAKVRGGFDYTDKEIADIITARMHERAKEAILSHVDDNSGFGLNAALIHAVIDSLNSATTEKTVQVKKQAKQA